MRLVAFQEVEKKKYLSKETNWWQSTERKFSFRLNKEKEEEIEKRTVHALKAITLSNLLRYAIATFCAKSNLWKKAEKRNIRTQKFAQVFHLFTSSHIKRSPRSRNYRRVVVKRWQQTPKQLPSAAVVVGSFTVNISIFHQKIQKTNQNCCE